MLIVGVHCPAHSAMLSSAARLRAFVAQMNRQPGIQRQRGGNGKAWNDAAPFRRAVGGDDVGTMTDAADDRRPFPRLTARENAERQIGKMQAGPKHFHASFPREREEPSVVHLLRRTPLDPGSHSDRPGRDLEIATAVLRGSGPGTRLTSSARASARFQMRACGAPTG